jgi:SAM-dependent methyltransferase
VWETPIYRFNRDAGRDRSRNRLYEQIVIDVTKSAPSFATPGKTLESAFREVIAATGFGKKALILDFGAGKLRNTLYFLQKGYRVCAVEFEELFRDSDQAAAYREKARLKGTRRFSTMIYPRDFEHSKHTFDLVLLINVLNVMPVPAERLLVLQFCYKKLRPGGCLFWYTQRGDADYAPRLTSKHRLGDGYYIGYEKRFKTFYREYTAPEIDALLSHTGFEFVRSIDATSRNQARLFRRNGLAPITTILTPAKIEASGVVDETIPDPPEKPKKKRRRGERLAIVKIATPVEKTEGRPDPTNLKIPELCIEKLESIEPGKESAGAYQLHVMQMLSVLFPDELRDLEKEVTVFSGIKRLDIKATNKSRTGFFYSLNTHHHIDCATIVIECKNYRFELKNPEFDQLGSRLGNMIGRAGILAYRNSKSLGTVLKKCRYSFHNDNKVIIPLSDKDFAAMLKLKTESKDLDIERFLDQRFFRIRADAD